MQLPGAPVLVAPDGSDVRILLRLGGGSMAHFEPETGRWPGLPGGRPLRRGRALVHPDRSRPDVAAPGRAAGDGAAAAWHLPVHPGGHALPVPRRDGGPLAAVGVTMPPWPGDTEAYEVPGAWPGRRLRLTIRRETPELPSGQPRGGRGE